MVDRKAVRAAGWAALALVAVVALLSRPRLTHAWIYWLATHRGEGASLAGADLASADLSRVNLKRANLRGACLERATCFDTNLRGADLREANLRGAILAGADLQWARLDGVKLTEVVYDPSTRWPQGFHPMKHGALPARWDASVWRALGRPSP